MAKLIIPSPFAKTISSFNNEETFPEILFIVPGLDKPFNLHRKELGVASSTLKDLLRGGSSSFVSYDSSRQCLTWTDNRSETNAVYREALVKWLRFCYGEDQTFTPEECPAALASLFQLKLAMHDEVKRMIESHMMDTARTNIALGTKMLVDCARVFDECHNDQTSRVDKALATIVLTPENMKKDPVIVVDQCLMLLPSFYLDVAKCELHVRINYIKFHTDMSESEKCDLLKDCCLGNLDSEEVDELYSVGVFNCRAFVKQYHIQRVKERDEDKKRIALLEREIEMKERRKQAKTLIKVGSFLKEKPEVMTATKLYGNQGNFDALLELLKVNATPTEQLKLCNVPIGDEEVRKVSEALISNTTLTRLHFRNNCVGAEGIRMISEALKVNTTLKKLCLWFNRFGSEGFKPLGEVLRTNTTLTFPNLKYTELGVEEARVISEILKTNTTWTSLNIGGNHFGDKGAILISEALMTNTTLTHLNLEVDEIGDEGTIKLSEALKKNSALKLFSLWGNKSIGDEGEKAMIEALKINTSLDAFYLPKNTVSEETIKALQQTWGSRKGTFKFN